MKSSKYIPPRVGMQVNFISAVIAITSLGRDWFEGIVIANVPKAYCQPGERWVGGNAIWNSGNYSITWQPPTDDERRLFMEAARHWRHPWRQPQCAGEGPCHWGYFECPGGPDDVVTAFESLALDGADYDNMPDLEELER